MFSECKMAARPPSTNDMLTLLDTWRILVFISLLLILSGQAIAFENLIQAQGEVRKDLPAEPLHFAQPNWTYYHRTDYLQREIVALASSCPGAQVHVGIAPTDASSGVGSSSPASLLQLGRRWANGSPLAVASPASENLPASAGEGLLYVTLQRADGGNDMATNVSTSRGSRFANLFSRQKSTAYTSPVDSTTVMFVFGEEGRDLFTSEVAFRILKLVCDANASTLEGADAAVLPSHTRVVLVPIANPDGRRISEMGRRCDRTNARDVDIDRNWPSFWGEDETAIASAATAEGNEDKIATSHDGNHRLSGLRHAVARRFSSDSNYASDIGSPLSGGTQPLSEPETRALKGLIAAVSPAAYISLRTGALALTTPWDCKPGAMGTEASRRLHSILEPVAAGHCTRCRIAPLWNATRRAKCGTAMDHVYGAMNVPFAFSWLVYDDAHAPHGDCFRRHNPSSHPRFNRVVDNWAHATFNFTAAVRNWVLLERHAGVHVAEQNASRSAAEASERRARALAGGAPDPEGDDSEDQRHANVRHAVPIHPGNVDLKQGNPFSWVLNKQKSSTISQTLGQTKLNKDSPPKASWADGWLGVSTAFVMLVVCLFIAKHYVFKTTPANKILKKSRFLSRAPIKNA